MQPWNLSNNFSRLNNPHLGGGSPQQHAWQKEEQLPSTALTRETADVMSFDNLVHGDSQSIAEWASQKSWHAPHQTWSVSHDGGQIHCIQRPERCCGASHLWERHNWFWGLICNFFCADIRLPIKLTLGVRFTLTETNFGIFRSCSLWHRRSMRVRCQRGVPIAWCTKGATTSFHGRCAVEFLWSAANGNFCVCGFNLAECSRTRQNGGSTLLEHPNPPPEHR